MISGYACLRTMCGWLLLTSILAGLAPMLGCSTEEQAETPPSLIFGSSRGSGPAPDIRPSGYRPLRSEADLMLLVHGLHDKAVPWEALAESREPGFAATEDRFLRNEMLAYLQPGLQQALQRFRLQQRWAVTTSIQLDAYDFARQGFAVRGFEPGHHLRFGSRNYAIAFTNGSNYSFVRIRDEGVAREIEAIRAQDTARRHTAHIHLHVRDVVDEAGRLTLRARIERIRVERPDGSHWFDL